MRNQFENYYHEGKPFMCHLFHCSMAGQNTIVLVVSLMIEKLLFQDLSGYRFIP